MHTIGSEVNAFDTYAYVAHVCSYLACPAQVLSRHAACPGKKKQVRLWSRHALIPGRGSRATGCPALSVKRVVARGRPCDRLAPPLTHTLYPPFSLHSLPLLPAPRSTRALRFCPWLSPAHPCCSQIGGLFSLGWCTFAPPFPSLPLRPLQPVLCALSHAHTLAPSLHLYHCTYLPSCRCACFSAEVSCSVPLFFSQAKWLTSARAPVRARSSAHAR